MSRLSELLRGRFVNLFLRLVGSSTSATTAVTSPSKSGELLQCFATVCSMALIGRDLKLVAVWSTNNFGHLFLLLYKLSQ
jgi:hypothetical protein